jgi:carboxylesterase
VTAGSGGSRSERQRGSVRAPSAVLPGSEAYASDAGPLGVLLLHGFGGSPASLRTVAEWFTGTGASVRLPRLPGHGTSFEDLAATRWPQWVDEAGRALTELVDRCDRVAILGHSMGAALALHLAANRPDDVAALALANPYLRDRRLLLVPIGRWVLRSTSAHGTDSKNGATDPGRYTRRPVPAIVTLRDLLRIVDRELPRVHAPIAVFTSTIDHEIPRGSAERILARVRSEHTERIECPNSYHALPLDHDAPILCERSLAFFRATTRITPRTG